MPWPKITSNVPIWSPDKKITAQSCSNGRLLKKYQEKQILYSAVKSKKKKEKEKKWFLEFI
jgi:hypothetical protein